MRAALLRLLFEETVIEDVAPLTVRKADLLKTGITNEELTAPYINKHMALSLLHNNREPGIETPCRVTETFYAPDTSARGLRRYFNNPACNWPGTSQNDLCCELLIDHDNDIYRFGTYARHCQGPFGPYQTYRAQDIMARQDPDDDSRFIVIFATNMAEGIAPKKAEYIDPAETPDTRRRAATILRAVLDNMAFIREQAAHVTGRPDCEKSASYFPSADPKRPLPRI